MADPNLNAIKFKRTSTENKAPGADILQRGELALNTHGRTLAIYTKDEADKVVQLTGKGVPFLDTAGDLTVAGSATFKDGVTVSPNKSINFEASDLSGNLVRHIIGRAGANDGWYIGAGGASDQGFLEIGTYDNGNEPIYFVQRTGGTTQEEARRLALLDASGDTSIPGHLRLNNKNIYIRQNGADKMLLGVGSSDIYIRNQKASSILQIKDDGNLTFTDKQVYYALDGKGPGKSGTLLTNVENNRQAWQYTLSANTGGSVRWVKLATIKDPNMGSAQLDLMITGAIDSGTTRHYVDFITVSGRSLSAWNTSNLDNWIEWRRIGSPIVGKIPEYYVVKSATSFDVYAKFPQYSNALYVTVLNTAGYNGKDDGTVIIYESNNDIGATGPTGNIKITMKQIFDSSAKPDVSDTTGTIPVNRGGTGATTAGDARNNLGLRTAAVRDVGTSSGQVMEVGAFGLGAAGTTYKETSTLDLIKKLRSSGGQFFRNETSTDASYGMGASFYSRVADCHAALSVDYQTGNVKVFGANDRYINGETGGRGGSNILYGTANKPQASDNDFVSKKDGGTYAASISVNGDVTAENIIGRVLRLSGGGASYIPPSQGAYVSWNKENGKGRTDFINHRSNTSGVEGGFDFWNYEGNNSAFKLLARIDNRANLTLDGKATFQPDGNIVGGSLFAGNLNSYLTTLTGNANNRVSKSGDTMTGRLTIDLSKDTNSNANALYIKGNQHTPLVLERDDIQNLSIAFRLTKASPVLQRKLGIAVDGYLHWGPNDSQSSNAVVYSQDYLDSNIAKLTAGYTGGDKGELGFDLSGFKGSLNDIFIGNRTDPGTRRTYYCPTQGGGNDITGMPVSNKGNFILYVESLRQVDVADFRNKQTFIQGDTWKTFVRYGQGSGTSNALTVNWQGWKEVGEYPNGVVPIANGGTNSTSVGGARNNLGLGEGQDVKFSNLEITNDVLINGNSRTKGTINFGSIAGSLIRANEAGAVVLGSSSGQPIHIRAGSESTSTGETRFDPNGNVTINGTLTTNNISGLAVTVRNNLQVNGTGTINGTGTVNGNLTANSDLIVKGNSRFTGAINADNNINMASNRFVIAAAAPTAANHLTNKAYVDKEVKAAIDGAGDTYLPLKGGTVKGTLVVDNVGPIEKKGIRTYTDGSVTVNETDGIKMFGAGSNSGTLRFTERVGNSAFIGLQSTAGDNTGWFEFHTNGMFRANHAELTTGLRVKGSPIVQPTSDNNAWASINFRHTDGTTNRGILFADAAGNIGFSNINGKNVIWNSGNYFIIQQGELNVGVNNGGTGEGNEDRNKANFYNKGSIDCAGTRAYQDANAGNRWVREVRGVRHLMQGTDLGSENIFVERVGERHFHMLHVFGANSNGWFEFRNNGDMSCNGTLHAKDVYITSDRRHKRNITKVENSEEILNKLSAYNYEVQDPTSDNSWEKSTGLIAQEVQDVLPTAVNDSDPEHIRLNYNAIVAVLVDQVNKLTAKVNELESKIN